MTEKRKKIISLLIIIAVSVITYRDMGSTFFQQDEWATLGRVMKFQGSLGLLDYLKEVVFEIKAPRLLPFTLIGNYLIFKLFGLNISYYGIFAFFIVTINSLLIYFTVQKLLKSSLASTAASLLWLTNSLSSDTVTWVGTTISSQFSFMFFVISIYYLLSFIEKPKETIFFIRSLVFMSVSLWFKEIGLYYFIPFILYLWLFSKKERLSIKFRRSGEILLPLLITFFLTRLIIKQNMDIGAATTVEVPELPYLVYNFFLIPARGLFHVFLPQVDLYNLFHMANKVRYFGQTDGFVVDNIIPDAFSLLISFYLVTMIGFLSWFLNTRHRKILLLAVVSFIFSFVPILLFQNKDAILDPRYHIFPAFWASILVAVLIAGIFNKGIKRIVAVVLLILLINHNISSIHYLIDQDIVLGNYRRKILATINEIKPELGDDNVFYFFTSYTGFYEFQSGFGQTLAVWFFDTGKIPPEVMTDADFWDFYYEGLKVYDGKKYGYFMFYDKLLGALQQNSDISLNNVHAYYWDHPKHTVENVSGEIRQKLLNDLSQ
jgi:hypothetical protein